MWKDLALAALIGVLFGLSPHTSATRPSIKIAGGVIAGIGVFLWRLRARRLRPVEGGPARARAETPGSLPPLVWLALALPGLLFVPAALRLFQHYTEDIWTNGHGLFVPLVSAGLALAILRRDPSPEPESAAWGSLPIGVGLALLVLDSAVATLYASVLGLLLLLFGMSLVLLGARRTRALAFPLLLLLFLIPLPTSLAMPLGLNQATASGTALVFEAFGSPVTLIDTVLERPSGLFGISAHCSGFSAFYAAVALACVLGYCGGSAMRFALLLLAVWPLVAVANILRTAVIVKIWEAVGAGFHTTPWHGLSGIAAFWLVMLGLLLMADWRALRESFA